MRRSPVPSGEPLDRFDSVGPCRCGLCPECAGEGRPSVPPGCRYDGFSTRPGGRVVHVYRLPAWRRPNEDGRTRFTVLDTRDHPEPDGLVWREVEAGSPPTAPRFAPVDDDRELDNGYWQPRTL